MILGRSLWQIATAVEPKSPSQLPRYILYLWNLSRLAVDCVVIIQ